MFFLSEIQCACCAENTHVFFGNGLPISNARAHQKHSGLIANEITV